MNILKYQVLVINMEQRDPGTIPPARVNVNRPPIPGKVRYRVGARGLVFFIIAIIILFFGMLGYLEYNRIVKPYLEVYICCLPAVILAGILIFFGFATQVTAFRTVQLSKPIKPRSDEVESITRSDLSQKTEPGSSDDVITRPSPSPSTSSHLAKSQPKITNRLNKYDLKSTASKELVAQKRNLVLFLKNLDDQHKDGLLMDDVYLNLKNKYKKELSEMNIRLKTIDTKKNKKLKK
jgi:hypothetical protein